MLLSSLRRVFQRKPSTLRRSAALRVEALEDRTVPAIIPVTTLADDGAGSLRAAILAANSAPGADTITFTVAGTIQLTSAALPDLTDKVTIDGTTAPTFASMGPVVEIDFNNFAGLLFAAGSKGSSLKSLGLVSAGGAGVTLDAGNVSLFGNFIGLDLNATTGQGNVGNGITINATSSGNTIGGTTTNQPNVISGNGGDGIAVIGSKNNTIINNFIGTDATGMVGVGNGGNGVRLTAGANKNTLGGTTPLATSPTTGSGVKPQDGNVISDNGANGVLITDGSNSNTLAGNFVGTDISGNVGIGNTLDGIAILNRSNNNSLPGTFANLQPFVFYNVSSGNGGNGLRINNSNNTVVHANFFGLGANNSADVGNDLNGVLIEGSSANTQFGGPIPLGNVTSANGANGLVIADTATGTVSFNTFAGLAAFSNNLTLGNAVDGILITSTGGNNLVRTSISCNNGDDGIEISGNARGVQVAKTTVGMSVNGMVPLPNSGNGIEVSGNAANITIGGLFKSINPFNLISANDGNGIAILGNANNVRVIKSFIGSDLTGMVAQPNGGVGILVSDTAHDNVIGGDRAQFGNLISGNTSHGIQLDAGTRNTRIAANLIGANTGRCELPNGGSGVFVNGSVNNLIGGATAAASNFIAFNAVNGVQVMAGLGNSIRHNSITSNGGLGIALATNANDNQAAPTLTAVLPIVDGIRIQGVLTSTPQSTFVVEIFADFQPDPTRMGEGRIFIGSVRVRTNVNGVGSFSLDRSLPPDAALFYSATATDLDGNTSPFSEVLDITTSLANQ